MIPKVGPGPKIILYAVLNWGLGHATRSIPIIDELISQGHRIVLASDGDALKLLKREYPQLSAEVLPPYNVTYKKERLWHIALSNAPQVFMAIQKEKKAAARLQAKHKADLIISDSRFGFRSTMVPSHIISHQLNLRSSSPILKKFLNLINEGYLNAFSSCWIPDTPDHKLSGELSQNPRIKKTHFLGAISRMKSQNNDIQYDLGILLSGPEPARSKLESNLVEKYKASKWRICIARGTTSIRTIDFPDSWTIVDLADTLQINQLIQQSERIVSRSGYTSILDYYNLKKEAFLIPTPGQSEQEYLSEYLNGKYGFRKVNNFSDLPTSY